MSGKVIQYTVYELGRVGSVKKVTLIYTYYCNLMRITHLDVIPPSTKVGGRQNQCLDKRIITTNNNAITIAQ